MKIAVVGASGNAGSRIVAELARRGHAVTAIARHPERIASQPNVTAKRGDVLDQGALTRLLAGHDAAVSSVHFLDSDPAKLIGAARDSKVGRYLVVGGAGSLEVAPGVRLVTTPGFPAGLQGRGREGRGFPRPAPAGQRAELDVPVAVGPVHRGPANRQVPARNGSAFDRRRWKKLDILRGFRSCTRRRDRTSRPYPRAFHGRLLARQARAQPDMACRCKALGTGRLSRSGDIVCHMASLYKARADGRFPSALHVQMGWPWKS